MHNEKDYIGILLHSLSLQKFNFQEFEIIVVDNNSSDNSNDVVHNFQELHPNMNIRLVYEFRKSSETGMGAGMARNTGATLAKGKVLIFLDADNLVKVDFLASVYKKVFIQKYEAGTIFTLPSRKTVLGYLVFCALEIMKMLPFKPFGKNFVTKEIFTAVHGYNEHIALGENVEFLRKVQSYLDSKGKNLAHITSPIYTSLRRFDKQGYIKVLTPWLLAYMGFKRINYLKLSNA